MPWDEFYSEYNNRLALEYSYISALGEPWQNRSDSAMQVTVGCSFNRCKEILLRLSQSIAPETVDDSTLVKMENTLLPVEIRKSHE
jgi:hypothetical protein